MQAKGSEKLQGISVFYIQQGSYTYELTVLWTACTHPGQDQVRPCKEMEVGHTIPPLAVKLLEMISCFWKTERQISIRCSPKEANHSPAGHTFKNIWIA